MSRNDNTLSIWYGISRVNCSPWCLYAEPLFLELFSCKRGRVLHCWVCPCWLRVWLGAEREARMMKPGIFDDNWMKKMKGGNFLMFTMIHLELTMNGPFAFIVCQREVIEVRAHLKTSLWIAIQMRIWMDLDIRIGQVFDGLYHSFSVLGIECSALLLERAHFILIYSLWLRANGR